MILSLRRFSLSRMVLMGAILILLLSVTAIPSGAAGPAVFINEIHYDNAGADTGEAIEITGPSCTDLTGWSIVLYNGSSTQLKVYDTIPLSGIISNQANGYGTLEFPRPGIQNGSPDGLALVDNSGSVIQFLSYEGVFTAVNGPAAGMTSTDIGKVEVSSTPVGYSLQLTGSGTGYDDFTWSVPSSNTFGAINTGQTITGAGTTNPCGFGMADPSLVQTGDTTLLTVSVIPGTNPASTGLAVTADLSEIGGSAVQTFYDDGTNGDLTANDNVFSYFTTVTISTPVFSIPVTITDDQSRSGTASIKLTPLLAIHDIQGSGLVSPVDGNTVAIEGIVVGDFQDKVGANGDLNGFFLQEEDADADADPATSEGIFVYQGSNPSVDLVIGDLVRVEGAVSEFNGLTQITSFSGVTVQSSGNALPTASILSLPVTNVDDFEAYEGMYVTFPQALVISEYFNFDRFNEIVLTSERHLTPTAEFEPGPDAIAAAQAFLLDSITLDDGRSTQNPDPAIHPNGEDFTLDNLFRGGDSVANVTGVMDYSFGLYRIQPTQGADYTNANPRTASPDDVGGNIKAASFNVLNYFTTLDDGVNDICGPAGDQECRGADDADEFTRQRDKIVAALTAINADVVGLIEIENHPADVPTADLVAGLNEVMGAGTYDYVVTGAIGTDAIRQAFIYKPDSVTPMGDFAVLDTSVDFRFLDDYNRPALAQTFMDNSTGGVFTVVVNHLKSKGSDCNAIGDPDLGDGAGNCNLTRKDAAEALVDWLATDPTGSGDADFLIIGDLNSYDKEDPIDALVAGGYTDLAYYFNGEDAYSYVFDGQIGYLDYALASAGLMGEVASVTEWHINADEPDLIDYDTYFKQAAQDAIYAPDAYRSSDHDPVIIGLDMIKGEVLELIDDVQTLVDDGILNKGQGNALTSKLENVLAKLAKGNPKAAANQLDAFINQVEDFVSDGILTVEQGDLLINVATLLVGVLRA